MKCPRCNGRGTHLDNATTQASQITCTFCLGWGYVDYVNGRAVPQRQPAPIPDNGGMSGGQLFLICVGVAVFFCVVLPVAFALYNQFVLIPSR